MARGAQRAPRGLPKSTKNQKKSVQLGVLCSKGFQGGPKGAFLAPFGCILEAFWCYIGGMFAIFWIHFLGCVCLSLRRSKHLKRAFRHLLFRFLGFQWDAKGLRVGSKSNLLGGIFVFCFYDFRGPRVGYFGRGRRQGVGSWNLQILQELVSSLSTLSLPLAGCGVS